MSQDTTDRGTNHSSFEWRLGERSSEQIDIVNAAVDAGQEDDVGCRNDVTQVGEIANRRQAAKLAPSNVAGQAVIAAPHQNFHNFVHSIGRAGSSNILGDVQTHSPAQSADKSVEEFFRLQGVEVARGVCGHLSAFVSLLKQKIATWKL